VCERLILHKTVCYNLAFSRTMGIIMGILIALNLRAIFMTIDKSFNQKRYWFLCFGVFSVILCGYWKYQAYYPATDDAYLHADTIAISPQVSGKVVKIYVQDNQLVKKGERLFDIDPQPYLLAVAKAKANLQYAQQQVAALSDAANIAKA